MPGIVVASVPKGFLGEELFSRALYVELLGSTTALGSDSNFARVLVQSERNFDLTSQWHLLLRGELGASIVDDFSELPGIYRFFAGGDRSVRGFAYQALSPKDVDGKNVGGRNLLVGSTENRARHPLEPGSGDVLRLRQCLRQIPATRWSIRSAWACANRLPGVSIGLDVAKPLSYPHSKLRLHLNISPKL